MPVLFLFRFYFRVSDLRFKGFFWFFNMSHSGQRRQAVHPGFSGSPVTQFIAESAYVCRNTRGLQIQAVTAVAENMQIKTDNVLLRRLPRGIISAFFFSHTRFISDCGEMAPALQNALPVQQCYLSQAHYNSLL